VTKPPLVDVEAFSARISARTVWTFVRALDANGFRGWGEATLQGEHLAVHAHVAAAKTSLAGQSKHPSNEPRLAANTPQAAAASAIDQALCDITAQHIDKPLADTLGRRRRSSIELYANINRGTRDRSPSGFAERAREATDGGFDAVKIAPFDDVTADNVATPGGHALLAAGIERVAAVRAAIGPSRRLLVDCHWRLTEASASDVLRELEPCGLYWFECPLAEVPAMFPALRRLRSRANDIGVRLAGCESLTGVAAFGSFLDAGVYDVVMPDVKYAGGLAEMLRIADAAATHGVLCSPHNPTGPIAHMHSIHISSLLAEFPFLEFQYGESPLFFDIVEGDLPDLRSGTTSVPRGPGLGIGIDMAKLSPLLVGFP
jgi:galactonate dehydratase